ncbi:MAG TPA: LacI family DNA-binding transcriptional regulator, partial [bacterium]
MSATLNDIAKKSGISISTISRVLNGKAEKFRIAEETAQRVLRTAEELHYRPNQLARGLRLKKTHTLGLLVPDISNPFFAYITRSVQRVAHKLGYSLIVCDTDDNLESEEEHLSLLTSKGVDGLIIMPIGQKCGHIKSAIDKGLPVVLMDRSFDDLKTNWVVVDNYTGAFKAVEHLITFGHTRIAIIQGLPDTSTNDARVNGYKDALAKHNIAIDVSLIVGNDYRKENGYIETKFLLNLLSPPTAIFTTSDLITLGALQALSEEKHIIPKDVSIVSFDDIDFAPYLLAPLTTVRQPKEVMGEIAVKLVVEDIKSGGKREKSKIVLQP